MSFRIRFTPEAEETYEAVVSQLRQELVSASRLLPLCLAAGYAQRDACRFIAV